MICDYGEVMRRKKESKLTCSDVALTSNTVDCTERFPFDHFTDDLMLDVAKKISLAVRTRFEGSSRAAYGICNNLYKIHTTIIQKITADDLFDEVDHIKSIRPDAHHTLFVIEKLIVGGFLSPKLVKRILTELPNLVVKDIDFETSLIKCSLTEFIKLSKALQVDSLSGSGGFQAFLHCISGLKNLRSLRFLDRELMSASEINQILRECINGFRKVNFAFSFTADLRSDDALLEGLSASLVWSRDTHHLSIISHIYFECIDCLLKRKHIAWYTCYYLWCPSRIYDIFTLEVTPNTVYFKSGDYNRGFLSDALEFIS